MDKKYLLNTCIVDLGGYSFVLLPDKALYWPLHDMLIIADAHFGKISHFRRAGASLPLAAAQRQLSKFEQLLETTHPDSVVFLGDLFHSDLNDEWRVFTQILHTHKAKKFILVEGNHDVLNTPVYQKSGIELVSELVLDGIRMVHHPITATSAEYVICGHIHPGYVLEGKGRQKLRLPCFWKGKEMAVLPAYGDFTGLCIITPKEGESVFLITGNQISRIDF